MKWIYYRLRHLFTGKHWYECTWEWPVRDEETFLTQECRFCDTKVITTHGEWRALIDHTHNLIMDQMLLSAFKPIYTLSEERT